MDTIDSAASTSLVTSTRNLFAALTFVLIVGTAVLALLYSIDWEALSPQLIALVLMLGFLYWTTTLLPGPIRKLGKAAGKHAMKSVRKNKDG